MVMDALVETGHALSVRMAMIMAIVAKMIPMRAAMPMTAVETGHALSLYQKEYDIYF